ncbi:class I SAM-dependent RNA methyltransferase [bacterium SCSIO 12643]|nr:class I SAM-dependent RNA methyltransferase [bacterium SCSIO 12643]
MNVKKIFDPKSEQTIAVTTLYGLEELLADEIKQLGAKNVEVGNRVVHCSGNLKFIYKSCLQLRHALRVLVYLDEFEAFNPDQLYEKAYNLSWEDFMGHQSTFAIHYTVNSKHFTHTKYASLKLKDAIVDRIRQKSGQRPSIDKDRPDYQFFLHISDEFVSIYLDASGPTLNRRGYREETVEAPLNETLAAALVRLTKWDGSVPLIDGMCGSGTIPIEAVYQARRIPSQWYRSRFGFNTWKNFDKDLMSEVRNEAKSAVKDLKVPVYASDISDVSLASTNHNVRNARCDKHITSQLSAFKDLKKKEDQGVIIINPPYGERLTPEDINRLYKEIGDTLKQNFQGWDAWIITSNKDALKHIGLRTSKRIKLYNGPLETRFVHYELYRGSKKANKQH